MRLWNINPVFLDPKGLCGLWREALVAKRAIEARMTGKPAIYKNHPDVLRVIKAMDNPLRAIRLYLQSIYLNSRSRSYSFNPALMDSPLDNSSLDIGYVTKVGWRSPENFYISVPFSQILYELVLLRARILVRAKNFIPVFDALLKDNKTMYMTPGSFMRHVARPYYFNPTYQDTRIISAVSSFYKNGLQSKGSTVSNIANFVIGTSDAIKDSDYRRKDSVPKVRKLRS